MGEPVFDPVHDVRRNAPIPPDQEQRLHRDVYSDRPSRRARPWVLLVAVVLLVAAFVAIVVLAGGEEVEAPIGAPAPPTEPELD